MGLDSIVRAAVDIADTVTSSLQASVVHSAFTGQDAFGKPTYATAVSRLAIVEYKIRQHMTATGKLVESRAKVSFIRPIAPNGAANRSEPIDTRDKIILPDGTTGPIVDVVGLVDPTTNRTYLSEVYIGTGV
jgi:hypothetical protein